MYALQNKCQRSKSRFGAHQDAVHFFKVIGNWNSYALFEIQKIKNSEIQKIHKFRNSEIQIRRNKDFLRDCMEEYMKTCLKYFQ